MRSVNSSKKTIRKAVIAAAGFGTRFLPQTKAMPKEMLPLVDKPIIQYIVEELVEAGIEDIIIVTGYHKRSIEDHFDNLSADLRANLEQGNKLELLESTRQISELANFAYLRQKGPYGTATPVMNAAHLVGDEPFIYTYADDLIVAQPNRFKQLVALFEELQGIIVPCKKIDRDEEFERYGVLGGDLVREGVLKVTDFIEKPGKDKAPSDFANVGGYVLTPDVFPYIEKAKRHLNISKEFYINDFVIQPMIRAGKPVYGCLVKNSTYYDTGNKLEYLKTVVDFALRDERIGNDFQAYLRKVAAK